MKGAEHELAQDWDAILQEYDDAQLMEVLAQNSAVTENKKGLARFLMAQKLKGPDDISLCLEKHIDEQEEVPA